jgi:hypothetical protein
VRAEDDRRALVALPAVSYLVADRCLRRVGKDCIVSFETSLAAHPRAARRGSWVVHPTHWDGLPEGRTRATTVDTGAWASGISSPIPPCDLVLRHRTS